MLNIEKFKDEIIAHSANNQINILFKVFTRETGITCGVSLKEVFEWMLSEYREPILNEEEQRYLSEFCRPYKVVSIEKGISNDCTLEWIEIYVDAANVYNDLIKLPYFKANTMYKGMEPNKTYTPQELGIKCKNNPNGEIKHE